MTLESHMTDIELADEIIRRLNALIEDPDVRRDIGALMRDRVSVSAATANHPAIQVMDSRDPEGVSTMSFLGLLNGVVGVREDGWGHVTAVIDDDGELERFQKTNR